LKVCPNISHDETDSHNLLFPPIISVAIVSPVTLRTICLGIKPRKGGGKSVTSFQGAFAKFHEKEMDEL